MTERSENFCTDRLRVARTFRGWSQAELGVRVGVSHQFIGYLETGRKQPSDTLIRALADALAFEPDFFFLPPLLEFRDDECFWRKQCTPVSIRSRALAHGTLFGALVEYIDSLVKIPPPNIPVVPQVHGRADIERAAEKCRMQWGLGLDTPIKNVIHAIEWAGVVVTRFDGHADTIDAFSRPHRRSVIVLNNDKGSVARSIFDAAHECGHLTLHDGIGPGAADLEAQADMFASAFLMPRTGFLREFPRPRREFWTKSYWDQLFALKLRWRVSVAAIVRRGYDLSIIDAAQYRRAYKFMSAKGWLRGGEPIELKADEPRLVVAALSRIQHHYGITLSDIAHHLRWTPGTLAQIANMPLEGPVEKPATPGNVISLAHKLATRAAPQVRLPFELETEGQDKHTSSE